MLESVAHLVGLDMECLVLALVSQIAQGVELVEVRADIEVVESGKRVTCPSSRARQDLW